MIAAELTMPDFAGVVVTVCAVIGWFATPHWRRSPHAPHARVLDGYERRDLTARQAQP